MQTLFPSHYSVRCGCAQDYDTFVAKELEFRTALRYPPVTAMINVVVRGRRSTPRIERRGALAALVRGVGRRLAVVVLGPAPAPLAKLRGEHRAQFFLKGGDRARMTGAIRSALAARPALARRTAVDVDPVSML